AVHLVPAEAGLAQSLLCREPGAREQVACERLKLRPGDGHAQGLAVVSATDCSLLELAKGSLGTFGSGLKGGQGQRVGSRVVAMLLLELGSHVLDQTIVPILASQADIALNSQRFKALLRQPDQGHVKSAASQVIDQHGPLLGSEDVLQSNCGMSPGW